MSASTHSLLVLLSLAAASIAEETRKLEVPLFEGLGPYTRKLNTKQPQAQRYVDQGLMFMFAFNHDEAVRAFQQATRLDPDCAMAYWGMALASGMNYNDPSFTPQRAKLAAEALEKARAKAVGETP